MGAGAAEQYELSTGSGIAIRRVDDRVPGGARLLDAAALEVHPGQVERDPPTCIGVRWAGCGGEGVRQPTVSAPGGR
jgi:hypothetical protein